MFKHRLAISAVFAAAGILITAGGALAVEAVAKSAVNVRTGPGVTYGIVDKLDADELVDITECAPSGWCFVEHNGPDGWVSASYLTAPDDEPADEEASDGGGSNPDCGFGFTIGPSGPSLSINCGDAPPPPAPPPPPDEEEVQACFYVGANLTGASFCMDEGTKNSLNGTFNDKISSVELTGGAQATLCVNTNLGGLCKIIDSDTDQLAAAINNKASSLVVFTGELPEPPAPDVPDVPATYTTGPLALQQTYLADLDEGSITETGADVWYEAVTATEKYLKPMNGGKLALGDGSNRGYTGCSTESFSGAKIALDDAPIGTYVCAKTDEGRISQFRVNSFTGTTMNLGYTTWSN